MAKNGVKKCKASAKSFVDRKQDEKMLWTMKVLAWTQQEMLDAVALSLAEGFGFGEARLKRFHDAFEKKYDEIRALEKSDTPDNEYYIAKIEEALQNAWGKYYSPREERYDITLRTPDGKEIKI